MVPYVAYWTSAKFYHVNNIVIDSVLLYFLWNLGVAFEQGSLLNTPETVPFRLSRDIVDGMGICGIEGTFRKYEYKFNL